MYIPCKFKCQLSFNLHLNLIEACATQLYVYVTLCLCAMLDSLSCSLTSVPIRYFVFMCNVG